MLIQGVGDEVITVCIALFFIALVSLIWISTHVQERPPVRAVVIRSAQPAEILSAESSAELEQAAEATQQSIESATENSTENATENTENRQNPEEISPENFATIKVRFINETSLEIREKLSEKLGQFVTKHLDRHLNLTQEDRVRLIYNGRVLHSDQTLAQHGLKDNSVVHCLVQRSQNETNNTENQRLGEDSMDLDLSSFCFPLLGSLLMVIWWCQIVYAHYFNLATTISLVSLTVLFFTTAITTYMS